MIRIFRSSEPDVFKSPRIGTLRDMVKTFYLRESKERIQESFKFPKFPDQVVEVVKLQFRDKCAYCESKLGAFSPGHVDNFRPKRGAKGFDEKSFSDDHYWWLAYEWENLYLSCPECNYSKASWFPVKKKRSAIEAVGDELYREQALLIDPCVDYPNNHIDFLPNGVLEPKDEKGRVTIEILKLNREALVEARKEEVEKFRTALLYLDTFSKENDLSDSPQLTNVLDLLSEHPNQNYSAVKRQLLIEQLQSSIFLRSLISLNLDQDSIPEENLKNKEDWEKLYSRLGISSHLFIREASTLDFSSLDQIEKIEIRNVRSVNSLDIKFESKDPEQAPWMLLLGENGLGKTSILQAIALALVDETYDKEIASINLWINEKLPGIVKIFMSGKRDPITVEFSKKGIRRSGKHFGTFFLAYGATRLLPQDEIKPEETQGRIRVRNLFKPTTALHNASEWLYGLNAKRFGYMARGLKQLLLLNEGDEILKGKKENTINIRHSGGTNTLEEMSEGYKVVVALAADIMQTLDKDGTSLEDAMGFVLVDEIGSHLHPRWKMRIVSRLRKVFPRVQFIVTSHEPLCLRGIKEGEILVLKREDGSNDIEVLNNLPSPEEFRVDQLLTSEFFGLYSTSDPETEALFNEYYQLLAKSKLSDEESNRLLELKEGLVDLRHLGSNLREELMYSVIDELLAKELGKSKRIDRTTLKRETIKRVKALWIQNDQMDEDLDL